MCYPCAGFYPLNFQEAIRPTFSMSNHCWSASFSSLFAVIPPVWSLFNCFITLLGQKKAGGHFKQLIIADHSSCCLCLWAWLFGYHGRRWIVGCFQLRVPAFSLSLILVLSSPPKYQFPSLSNRSWESRTPSKWLWAWMGHMGIPESFGSLSNRR